MMKKTVIAVLAILCLFWVLLLLAPAISAEEKNREVTIQHDRGFMLWIIDFGKEEGDWKFNFKIKGINPNEKKYNLSFDFPEYPIKINFKTHPYILSADFYEFGREDYKITLAGFGTTVPYESSDLKGNVHVTFLLRLDTKLLKPQHFDILLNAIRTKTAVEIEGYVADKEKDFLITSRGNEDFAINIILHPVFINGQKLY